MYGLRLFGMLDSNLRLCTEGCDVKHYENCDKCFGFGLKNSYHSIFGAQLLPIIASEIEKYQKMIYVACDQCGGTPFGTVREI